MKTRRVCEEKKWRRIIISCATLFLALFSEAYGAGYYNVKFGFHSLFANSINSQGNATCARISGGVQCWGTNAHAQGGDGTVNTPENPHWVLGMHAGSGVNLLGVDQNDACGLVGSSLFCWGYNVDGEEGIGTTAITPTPTLVTGFGSVIAISQGSGGADMCVIKAGNVYCSGFNTNDQLGDGLAGDVSVFTAVVGIPAGQATSVSMGQFNGCAIASGALYCWGDNGNGQIGNGVTGSKYNTAQANLTLTSGVAQVSVGPAAICAMKTNGALYCWGFDGTGQVGNNNISATVYNTPQLIVASGVTQISNGFNINCAIINGGVQCWGNNNHGQVGDGTIITRGVPTPVVGMSSGISYITSGNNHACAITGGQIYCWGLDANGQLGDGGSTDQHTPVKAIIANP